MEGVMLSLMLVSIVAPIVTPMSIEKVLVTSATRPEVFDSFHVMPDGEIKVLQELDMMLSLDQFKQLYKRDKHERKKRKAAIDRKKWTNCLVYYEILESGINESARSNIMKAIDEWQKYTCLQFIKSHKAERRIQFKIGALCSSEVGMSKKIQELTLTSGCLESKGMIMHEIGHAIGWYHEHMRPDRDKHIRVDIDKVDDKFKKDYELYTNKIDTFEIKYDYTSIMHYGTDLFPMSIVTLDPVYSNKIGQRIGLSFRDIKLANVMYKCAEMCPTLLDCVDDGFQLIKNFRNRGACECWCDSENLLDPLKPCRGQIVTRPPLPSTPAPSTAKPEIECVDKSGGNMCDEHKAKGLCMDRIQLMLSLCAKTCGLCGMQQQLSGICMDYEPGCAVMAMAELHKDPGLTNLMSRTCKASSGLCEQPDPCEIPRLMDHIVKENIASMMRFSSTTIVISTILADLGVDVGRLLT